LDLPVQGFQNRVLKTDHFPRYHQEDQEDYVLNVLVYVSAEIEVCQWFVGFYPVSILKTRFYHHHLLLYFPRRRQQWQLGWVHHALLAPGLLHHHHQGP
jgi:hypothetical protein